MSILDAINVALRNFIFGNTVTVNDSLDVTLVGAAGDDSMNVSVQGVVENLIVDGGAGGDTVTLNMEASSATVTAADSGASAGDSLTVNTTGANDQVTLTAAAVSIGDTQTVNISAIETQTINTGAGDDALTITGAPGNLQVDGGTGTTTISADSNLVAPGAQVDIHGDGALIVEAGSVIDVSAVENGNGGKVIINSAGTQFNGTILARL